MTTLLWAALLAGVLSPNVETSLRGTIGGDTPIRMYITRLPQKRARGALQRDVVWGRYLYEKYFVPIELQGFADDKTLVLKEECAREATLPCGEFRGRIDEDGVSGVWKQGTSTIPVKLVLDLKPLEAPETWVPYRPSACSIEFRHPPTWRLKARRTGAYLASPRIQSPDEVQFDEGLELTFRRRPMPKHAEAETKIDEVEEECRVRSKNGPTAQGACRTTHVSVPGCAVAIFESDTMAIPIKNILVRTIRSLP